MHPIITIAVLCRIAALARQDRIDRDKALQLLEIYLSAFLTSLRVGTRPGRNPLALMNSSTSALTFMMLFQ